MSAQKKTIEIFEGEAVVDETCLDETIKIVKLLRDENRSLGRELSIFHGMMELGLRRQESKTETCREDPVYMLDKGRRMSRWVDDLERKTKEN